MSRHVDAMKRAADARMALASVWGGEKRGLRAENVAVASGEE
jgi:hypothetical protein